MSYPGINNRLKDDLSSSEQQLYTFKSSVDDTESTDNITPTASKTTRIEFTYFVKTPFVNTTASLTTTAIYQHINNTLKTPHLKPTAVVHYETLKNLIDQHKQKPADLGVLRQCIKTSFVISEKFKIDLCHKITQYEGINAQKNISKEYLDRYLSSKIERLEGHAKALNFLIEFEKLLPDYTHSLNNVKLMLRYLQDETHPKFGSLIPTIKKMRIYDDVIENLTKRQYVHEKQFQHTLKQHFITILNRCPEAAEKPAAFIESFKDLIPNYATSLENIDVMLGLIKNVSQFGSVMSQINETERKKILAELQELRDALGKQSQDNRGEKRTATFDPTSVTAKSMISGIEKLAQQRTTTVHKSYNLTKRAIEDYFNQRICLIFLLPDLAELEGYFEHPNNLGRQVINYATGTEHLFGTASDETEEYIRIMSTIRQRRTKVLTVQSDLVTQHELAEFQREKAQQALEVSEQETKETSETSVVSPTIVTPAPIKKSKGNDIIADIERLAKKFFDSKIHSYNITKSAIERQINSNIGNITTTADLDLLENYFKNPENLGSQIIDFPTRGEFIQSKLGKAPEKTAQHLDIMAKILLQRQRITSQRQQIASQRQWAESQTASMFGSSSSSSYSSSAPTFLAPPPLSVPYDAFSTLHLYPLGYQPSNPFIHSPFG